LAGSVWRYRAKVWAAPDKTVHLIHDDPRTFTIKTKALFDGKREFHGIHRVSRPTVSDGQDGDKRLAVLVVRGQDDGTRPTLIAFIATLFIFGIPQVDVTDNKTRLWDRKRHRLLEFVVKVLVSWIHFGLGDCVQFSVGQVAGTEYLP